MSVIRRPQTQIIISALAAMLQTATGQTTNETVNLTLQQSDTNYAARVTHHLAIKALLAAKDKGDGRVDRLMTILVGNGFSIEDFPKAYWVIRMPAVPPAEPYIAKLREWGRTDEEIAVRLKRRAPRDDAIRRNFIKEMTGITDSAFVEQMLLLEQEAKSGRGLGPILPRPKDGEKLLTDSDWLTDAYREAMAAYPGKPRHFSTFPIHLNPQDDSLLKLNENPARQDPQ